nr:MAG TPA: hypothetical protein [Caudoviricetes sp.]
MPVGSMMAGMGVDFRAVLPFGDYRQLSRFDLMILARRYS